MAKKTKKGAGKSVKKALRPKVISMDEVYRLLNRVQINKKEVVFALSLGEAMIADNVIKDLGLEYTRRDLKKKVVFTIFPNPEDDIEESEFAIEIDFLQDEILEDE